MLNMLSSKNSFGNFAQMERGYLGLSGALLRGIVGLALVYMIFKAVYNLWFHPLRKVPGPRLARISPLWSRIGNYSGTKSERIDAAHKRYGQPHRRRLSGIQLIQS